MPDTSKDKLLKRLTRTEGQIRGISRMVAADAEPIDIITQISAAQAALDKVALELLRQQAGNNEQPADTKHADKIIQAFSRLLAR